MKALLKKGYRVIIVDNLDSVYSPKVKKLRLKMLKHRNLKVIIVDLREESTMKKLYKLDFSRILHLASRANPRKSIKDPLAYESINNLAMLNILELARKKGIKHIVFSSSSTVYGNAPLPNRETFSCNEPISVYAATKKNCEMYAYVYHKLHGINTTILRFFSVYGEWGRPDSVFFKFMLKMKKKKPVKLFNGGKNIRDFTHVSDIVKGIIKAIEKPFKYEIINLGASKPYSVKQMALMLYRETGQKPAFINTPAAKGDAFCTRASTAKARRLLGYNPSVKLEDGIREYAAWFNENATKDLY